MHKKVFHSILFIILIFVVSACIKLKTWWHQPLGEVLEDPTFSLEPKFTQANSNFITTTPSSTIESETLTDISITPKATITITPEATKPLVEKQRPMYILVAGIASTDPYYRYGLADAIRIVRVDFEIPRVTVLSLPRDLWVALPGIKKEYGELTHGKLNTAYSYGTPALDRFDGKGGGPALLAHTIAYNYGLVVDHYAMINMEVFSDIIDALGGIDIFLTQTWDGRADKNDPDYMIWVFEEGQHHMKGDEALRFARIRLNYNDITRIDNQTMVLCAVKEKALRPYVVTAIPDIIKAFDGRIQTDLSPAQISKLIGILPKLSRENLRFLRFPNDMMKSGRIFDPSIDNTTFILDIPNEYIRDFMEDFQHDTISIDVSGGAELLCP